MVTSCGKLFQTYAQQSKGFQAAQRIKKKIQTFSTLIGKDPGEWAPIEIFGMWRYLESTSKQHLSHNGLRNLMQDIKVVFESWKLNQFDLYEKEIKLILNSYLNDRIDKEKLPWSKRNANRPPYKIWLLLAETMSKTVTQNDFTSDDKRMSILLR